MTETVRNLAGTAIRGEWEPGQEAIWRNITLEPVLEPAVKDPGYDRYLIQSGSLAVMRVVPRALLSRPFRGTGLIFLEVYNSEQER